MWLTILWQNKGLIALAALLALFVGLGTALKVQSARLKAQQKQTLEEREAKDEAIRAHDQLVADWQRQQKVLSEREALRKQQEVENEKLHRTIKDLLSAHRAWASGQLPRDLVRVLQTLPSAAGTAGTPAGADPPAPVHRADQRGFTLLGDGK